MYTQREPQAGDIATLNEPYLGYRRIELIEKCWYKWRVRICESWLGNRRFTKIEFEIDE